MSNERSNQGTGEAVSCATARARILDADLAELRDAATPLGRHLAECAACRARADAVLRGYQDLAAGLEALAAPREVLQLRRKWLRWTPLPLAAAAVLALLLSRSQELRPVPEPTALARLMMPAVPVVTPPVGKQAIVIEKNGLTVVWLY